MSEHLFGELRSLMNQRALDPPHRAALWALLCAVARDSPATYASAWRPYVETFPHHLREPLATLTSAPALERAVALLPTGVFSFAPAPSSSEELSPLAKARIARLEVSALDEATLALLGSGELESLRGLRVETREVLGVVSARALCELAHNSRLSHLELPWNALGVASARVLATTCDLGHLALLDLRHNALGNEGARIIAESDCLSGIGFIDLGWNGVRGSGARAIMSSARMSLATRSQWKR